MTVKRPRSNVTFHPDTFAALETVSSHTGLSVSHIVDQLVGAHLAELTEYAAWIERQEGEVRERGIAALEQYGPTDLITEMRNLDPTYQPPEARFAAFDSKEIRELRAMLAEWKARQPTPDAA